MERDTIITTLPNPRNANNTATRLNWLPSIYITTLSALLCFKVAQCLITPASEPRISSKLTQAFVAVCCMYGAVGNLFKQTSRSSSVRAARH